MIDTHSHLFEEEFKNDLNECIKRCKENNVHTAVDTAGNVSWEYFERILPFTDLFLYE